MVYKNRLNPVVVLVDIALQKNNLRYNVEKFENVKNLNESSEKQSNLENKKCIKRKNNLEYVHSAAFDFSPTSPGKENSDKLTWNPNVEYEVEKIVDHYRDKKNKMFYLVQWKNWPKKYNTYEPIENLTQCNYSIMKYFKKREPSTTEIAKMRLFIKKKCQMNYLYQKLIKNKIGKKDLVEFSTNSLNIEQIFNRFTNLKSLEEIVNAELKIVIECLVCMSDQRDEGMLKRAMNYRLIKLLIQKRIRQLKLISVAEEAINKLENVFVKIENEIDLELFPNFEYLADLKPGNRVTIPEAVVGCSCRENCGSKSKCCGKLAGSIFAYDLTGKLKIAEKIPIYECNKKCCCSSSCLNRVVQNGRKTKLCIFKTESYGWGVKTLEDIPKGTYICEYLGELIHSSEAKDRDKDYRKYNFSYLFDLDFNPDSGVAIYTIDATMCGNLARFINHSCSPNLLVCPVWIDCLDIDMPRLAFFAKKNIRKYEEITFDYQNAPEDIGLPVVEQNSAADIRCKCMAPNCRQWIFGIK